MKRIGLATVAAAALAAWSSSVVAVRAEQAPPLLPTLRHLVFSFNLTTRDARDQSMENIAEGSVGGKIARKGVDSRSEGRIVCDVVGASADGGLVVDVSEESPQRSSLPVRVAIHANGDLSYDPKRTPLEEELLLLKLLGRRVIGSDVREVGASWSVDNPAPDYKDRTTFRVSQISKSEGMALEMREEFRRTGAQGYWGSVQGTVQYEPAKLVPRAVNVRTNLRVETPQAYRTIESLIDLTLVEDSFAHK